MNDPIFQVDHLSLPPSILNDVSFTVERGRALTLSPPRLRYSPDCWSRAVSVVMIGYWRRATLCSALGKELAPC